MIDRVVEAPWSSRFARTGLAVAAGVAVVILVSCGAAQTKSVPQAWLTKAERTGFQETARYDEVVDYCRRLAAASDWVHLTSFGTSGLGRDLPLLIVSKDGAFTPEKAHAQDEPIVLIQNGIHAGEIEGKDASLMLVRDIVVARTEAALIDHAILLVMPIFNVDGHERFGPYNRINQNGPREMGWRVTSRNLNLNRDYAKADTVEMRAWLRCWTAWRPHLFFDNHTTNGAEHRYDLLYAWTDGPDAPASVAGWLNDVLAPQVIPALRGAGHNPIRYFRVVDRKDPARGIRSGGGAVPRYSTGYAQLHNRPSILVETHMAKPYETRVRATYNILKYTLEAVNRDPGALTRAVRVAEQDTVRMGSRYDPQARFPVRVEPTDGARDITFQGVEYRLEPSEVSGAVRVVYGKKPSDIPTKHFDRTRVSKSIAPPLAYLIPPQWTEVIELLELHGLKVERLHKPVTAEFESYTFHDPKWQGRPFEGRHMLDFRVEPIRRTRTYPAGSALVRLAQPSAKVAIHLLEPEAPDALVRWGFFDAVFEQKEYAEGYILEELAGKMLADDPALRAEFEERLRTDADFAGSPRERLQFFYRRSPYWDKRKDVYPVARVTRRIGSVTPSPGP